MDEFYNTPESDVLASDADKMKRRRIRVAWKLISKKFLVLVIVLNFLQLWFFSYFNMISYIEHQGDDPRVIGLSNIFFQMFDLSFILVSVISSFVFGLIPFLIVCYKQTNMSSIFAQLLWFIMLSSFYTVIWISRL